MTARMGSSTTAENLVAKAAPAASPARSSRKTVTRSRREANDTTDRNKKSAMARSVVTIWP